MILHVDEADLAMARAEGAHGRSGTGRGVFTEKKTTDWDVFLFYNTLSVRLSVSQDVGGQSPRVN